VFNEDGSIYNGEFHNNYPEGKGVLYYGKDFKGDIYSGEFLWGWKSGYGKYIWNIQKYGEIIEYEGQWCNDAWHGIGKETRSDGAVWYGKWENGNYKCKMSEKDWLCIK